jgi:putative GTP pyrophosphokinase
MTLEEDIQKWENEKTLYIKLKNYLQCYLEDLFIDNGLPVKVETRVKDDYSLIKKIIFKQNEGNSNYSYEKITDKCGARIICKFKEDISQICDIIDEFFEVIHTDNKYDNLMYNQQGYKGIHKDVILKKNNSNIKIFKICKNLPVEIQIRTLCDNVWADIYHDFGYKPKNMASEKIKRELHCLGGLLEVADGCFSKINKSIKESTEFSPAFVLNFLEKPFIQIFRSKYDPDYSTENLIQFINLLDFDSTDSFKTTLNEFIEKNKDKLSQIVHERRGSISNPFFTQPEVLIIFYLIDTKKYPLKNMWQKSFSINDLEELSTWWGKPILY